MSKQLFDDAIGEVPPSTVDVDAAIARGRRAARVHRVANPVVATVAAVAVLLGAVAVVLLSSGAAGGLGPAISSAPTSSTTVPPTTDPQESACLDGMAPTAPPGPEKPAEVEDRLTHLLTGAVDARLAPDATLVVHPGAQYPDGVARRPLEVFHVYSESEDLGGGACHVGEDYYIGWSDVRASAGTGNLLVSVARDGGANGVGTDCGTNTHVLSCHVKTTPGGDVAVQTTYRMESGTTQYRLDVTKADGTVVTMLAEDIAGSSKSGGAPTATMPPLTMAQLTAIALDPRLTMYPR